MAAYRRLLARIRSARRAADQRGQTLVLFALVSVVLIGSVAIVTDVSWLWVNQQRMQRASDAAALAGAIYLPGDPATAYSTARAEATKNGYTSGVRGVTVTPLQDPRNPRRLIVTIAGPVGTYFARIFCINAGACLETVPVSAVGRAEYVLPVPMGSPQNYYGVGYFVDAVTTTSSSVITGNTGWNATTLAVAGGGWQQASNAYTNNNVYASATNNHDTQTWNSFRILSELPNDASLQILGLQVRLTDVFLAGIGTWSNCQVQVEASWDAGTTWSTAQLTSPALNTDTSADRTVGSASSVASWGGHTWTRNDFTDTNFQVRLEWLNDTVDCASTRSLRLDLLEAQVDYRWTQVTSTTTIQPMPVVAPDGTTLAPQNFWGSMQSQGAPSIQGDAHMTYYNPRTSGLNSQYDYETYYNYAVEMPAGTTGGQVWIFDPGFCDVSSSGGTGEYYTLGGANGSSARNPVSAFFDLWDTNNTPYDGTDDTLVASAGNTFRRLNLVDTRFGVSGATDCSGIGWHHGWWQLASGLSGGSRGRVYRLHSYSTDTSAPSDQLNATALNGFAFWSTATGGTPRIYGIGAMEAYVRLPGATSTQFYLAQIEAQHAGKTLQIDLWDPGDTGALAASLEILQPTTTSYTPIAFSYTAQQIASGGSSCSSRSGTNVTSVTTNTGGTSLFNGCMLTITIAIPNSYDAPHPSSDTVTAESGWWKIRYNMSGSTSSFATDLTTWQVSVRGSPVHLVVP